MKIFHTTLLIAIFLGGNVIAEPLPKWVTVEGVETILAEKHDTPLVSLNLTFPVGSYVDPKGKEGLSAFFGDMLLRGTKNRSRKQIEDNLDHLGASLRVSTGFHTFAVEGSVLSRNLDKLTDLILDLLTQSTFPEVEIDKLREETIAKLHLRLEDDADLTRMKLFENLFAGHPYGRTQDGTLASLRSLTRADISDYFKTHLHHGGMLLGASGDITRERLNELARKLVGALPKGKATELVVPFTAKLKGLDVILVDKPERSQSHFFIAQPGIHARDKDYFPLNVFMTAFAGGLFQAQYMQEIRVKRGWAYGASGRSDARRDGGGIWLYTYPKTADTIAAIKLSLDLLEKAVNGDGLSDDAIEFSKKYLARSFPFLIDVPDKVISERIYQKIVGQGDDFLETYVSRIEAVTSAQARAAAKANLSSKNVRIVMLCTAKDFEKTIGKELGATSVKVVPYNRL